MQPSVRHLRTSIVEYDALRRRVWILGQRCHHGATGSVVTATACIGLVLHRGTSMVALAATGTALMAHDWKDRSLWFKRGRGSQE
jgi:hypothetical protein